MTLRSLSFAFLLSATAATAQLNGTYTVGGSAPQYADLSAALTALQNEGANGAVTFVLRAGTYTGQYHLADVPGTPGTITITAADPEAELPVLSYAATSADDNYILRIDGVADVHLEHLHFLPTGATRGRSVVFRNAADGLSIRHCRFDGPTDHTLNLSDNTAITCDQTDVGENANPQGITIHDNDFHGGLVAMELEFRLGTPRSSDLSITNNRLTDQLRGGITLQNASGTIHGNTIRAQQGQWFFGIRCMRFSNGSAITGNDIRIRTEMNGTGIEHSNAFNDADLIANNSVLMESFGDGEVNGILLFNTGGLLVAHNTVVLQRATRQWLACFEHTSSFPDQEQAVLRNNIFCNYAGGPAVRSVLPENYPDEDHNVLFTSGDTLVRMAVDGGVYLTMAAYQAGTDHGGSSLHADPAFPFLPSLDLDHCTLDDQGTALPAITTDITGNARHATTPDHGAYEYTHSGEPFTYPVLMIGAEDLPYTLALNGSFATYLWDDGSTAATRTITSAEDATYTYTCTATDAEGCSYTLLLPVEVVGGVGIAQQEHSATWRLFPNPASDRIHVEGLAFGTLYRIMDLRGAVLAQGALGADRMLGLEALPAGLYLLQPADGALPQRFVKR